MMAPLPRKIMDLMQLMGLILHVDKTLGLLIDQYGTLVYVVLFAIIFSETAFVILPFLPGDSLLFIAGTFSANGTLSVHILILLLIAASVMGNSVNYWIGNLLGSKIMEKNFRWIDRHALEKTHNFYERHGGKTVVLARFLPLVRTFAPFVAGLSKMSHQSFQIFNVVGAILWIVSLVLSGYFFGNIPQVKNNLNLIVLIGVGAAIVPIILGVLWKLVRPLRKKKP
jgi:membrane-associated protein